MKMLDKQQDSGQGAMIIVMLFTWARKLPYLKEHWKGLGWRVGWNGDEFRLLEFSEEFFGFFEKQIEQHKNEVRADFYWDSRCFSLTTKWRIPLTMWKRIWRRRESEKRREISTLLGYFRRIWGKEQGVQRYTVEKHVFRSLDSRTEHDDHDTTVGNCLSAQPSRCTGGYSSPLVGWSNSRRCWNNMLRRRLH